VSGLSPLASATPNGTAFAAWAPVYDQMQNPLLALEERILRHIFPECRGKDVVDVGCGTGRWLDYFSRCNAASICGLDSTQAMLDIAAKKACGRANLLCAELPGIPLERTSVDLALASFVLGYVEDLEICAGELARALRPGGDLLVSDMHAETAKKLGWERSFRSGDETYTLTDHSRSLAEVIDVFVSRGFTLVACLEPQFGRAEYDLFLRQGKDASWREVGGRPPIYLFHFKREDEQAYTGHALSVRSARVVLGPDAAVSATISTHGEVLSSMFSESTRGTGHFLEETLLDLHGYLLFPGLVNAHDHLEFSLFPRLGAGLYRNASEWANDIHENCAGIIELQKTVPKEARLWWGGVRNLLCGVTTVLHHDPLHPILRSQEFPVRVIHEFGWEHSLAFGHDIQEALSNTDSKAPFIVHAGEGIDESAAAELDALDALGTIEERSVLVHGLALDLNGIERLNKTRASLVICPSSNQFLFGQTHSPAALQSVSRLALGSDSCLTAVGDLLDELRFAHQACQIEPARLFGMVTREAAQILRLQRGEGRLCVGGPADFFAIRDRSGEPADILANLSWNDVELVVVGAQIHLVSTEIYKLLPASITVELQPIAIEGQVRWLRGDVDYFLEQAEEVLGKGMVRVGGLRVTRVQVD